MKRLLLLILVLGMTVTVGCAPGGEKARDGRFIAYYNGTVLDTRTNLMWAAKDNYSDINWANAKSYCENYRGGGYKDWRMSTLDELAGLHDVDKSYSIFLGVVATDVFLTKLIQLSFYQVWASETRGSQAAYFWFNTAMQGWGRAWAFQSRSIGFRALPVRSVK
jgi:hypothetical protein